MTVDKQPSSVRSESFVTCCYVTAFGGYLAQVTLGAGLYKRDSSSKAQAVHVPPCLHVVEPVQNDLKPSEEVDAEASLLYVRLWAGGRMA